MDNGPKPSFAHSQPFQIFLDSLWSKVEIISGSTATEIDDRLSPGNVTRLSGETALLACKIYNLGNKSVSKQ